MVEQGRVLSFADESGLNQFTMKRLGTFKAFLHHLAFANFTNFFGNRVAKGNIHILSLLGKHAMPLQIPVLGESSNHIEIDRVTVLKRAWRTIPFTFPLTHGSG